MMRGQVPALSTMALAAFLIAGSTATTAPVAAEEAEAGEAVSEETAPTLTLAEVREMSAAGLGDEVIVAKIEASNAVFNLAVDEILRLKREGVSDRVLASLVRTGVIQKHYGTRASRRDAPERHAVARDVVVERYVPYDYDAYYYPRSRWYPRRYGVSFNYGYPWYGTYAYPWYGSSWSGGHHYGHGGHYWGNHGGGHHGGHHDGHYGSGGGGNHHGGHKPSLGPRTTVGGRGGRR